MFCVDVFGLIFHPGDSFLGPQVIIFAIQGSPGSAKRIHRDPGLDFHRFFMDLGTLFRTCFEAVGSLFRDLRDTNSSIGFQIAFEYVSVWKSNGNLMVRRAENLVNNNVFVSCICF